MKNKEADLTGTRGETAETEIKYTHTRVSCSSDKRIPPSIAWQIMNWECKTQKPAFSDIYSRLYNYKSPSTGVK